jgi:hypothetical protein
MLGSGLLVAVFLTLPHAALETRKWSQQTEATEENQVIDLKEAKIRMKELTAVVGSCSDDSMARYQICPSSNKLQL